MNDLQIMPCFSLEPNKLVLFNRVFKSSNYAPDGTLRPKTRRTTSVVFNAVSDTNTIQRKSHNMELSANAYRTLRKKINWLYYLSKGRYVKTYSEKDIFNFKMCFLTLSLSSKQQHSTADVTNLLFNTLLTELRQRTNMTNYVWRLEFQKNGNVHYHLCTDTYLDYYFVLKIWNRIQSLHGYVQPYTDKHSTMSLHEYNKIYNFQGATPFDIIAKRYANGKKNNWSQPNSVDCKSVISKKAIASYISKYFGKDAKIGTASNDFDTPENTENLRLWFCSRSLSKLKSISDFCEAFTVDVSAIVNCCTNIRKFFAQYATIVYFEFTQMPSYCRQVLEPILRNHAYLSGYKPSS